MARLAQPKSADPDAEFEGEAVVGTSVSIKSAGEGLSKAMSIDNELLRRHDVVNVLLECTVVKVGFGDAKDIDGTVREQLLKAGRATLIDADLAGPLLDEQDRKLEEAAGIQRLDFGEGIPDDDD